METIEEQQSQSKCEMSISTQLPLRICLVGKISQDSSILQTAESFGVPIVISETGLDIVNDYDWRTHYVIDDFEGINYEALHKMKQCILGPPALKYAADMKHTLGHNTRPIYNYSMRGVVTCFTGIRKKDELTKLVNLIHSMGGCIKKDLNTRTTHLICNQSCGEKYQYAKTFRLTVVRPAWVYAAWEQRDVAEFNALAETFSKEHKLKAFEGQKICFFGFPSEEHQHMVDVLLENGGVPAELDDPECSHVVMPDAGAYISRTESTATTNHTNTANTNTNNTNKSSSSSSSSQNTNPTNHSTEAMEVDSDVAVAAAVTAANNVELSLQTVDNKENRADQVDADDGDDDDNDDDDDILGVHFDERLVVDVMADVDKDVNEELPDSDEEVRNESQANQPSSTPQCIKPKSPWSTHPTPRVIAKIETALDGIVLSKHSNEDFEETSCNSNDECGSISPILSSQMVAAPNAIAIAAINECEMESDELVATEFERNNVNRKRRKSDSFDNDSLVSVESFALPLSSKKPKLMRAGSFKRTIQRSMSFVADRTPIFKTLRTRRSSIAASDASAYMVGTEADDSICSLASINTTLNESIRKPVKEKLRNICARVTRSASKKDKFSMLEEVEHAERAAVMDEKCPDGFKTPKAPMNRFQSTITAATGGASGKTLKSAKRLFGNSSFLSNSGGGSGSGTSTSTSHQTVKVNACSTSSAGGSTSSSAASVVVVSAATTSTTLSMCCLSNVINQHETITSSTALLSNTSSSLCAAAFSQHTNIVDEAMDIDIKKCQTTTDKDQENLMDQDQQPRVVDEHTTLAKPEPKNHHTHILKSDWFWYTIQNGFANEMDYLFGDYLDSIANTPNTDRRESLPISFNKRKRKRLSQRLQFEGTPLGSGKRRSSVSDAGLLSSVSNSFFDCTTSPEKLECIDKLHVEPEICEPTPTSGKKSMRFNHFMDFYTTESNYVGILDTILNLFKNKLEELAETNDPLLNKSEIKSIFGNFLPIHEVHQNMLERLRQLFSNWREDCHIGDIIMQHRDELTKAYPPYVNFYEQMKEQLLYCDREYPRFHAFLKINQTKPECGRQSLQDLMIRPVQRLPSISLLLNDILKHTNNNNPDHARLEEALKAIKEVMLHINEDKRRTESRMAIFDIFNDIEGCPAHLVSSNRSFISKCEANELSDCLSGRGDALMLYLFSDSIEVCKKRSRGFNTAKSPSATKTHKHIKLISLNTIRIVIDIVDSPRAFALLQRGEKEKLYTFSITDEETNKVMYLKKLCMQMAEHACRTDADKMLVSRTSQELEVDISDVNLSTLSKAFKLAAKTRLKVGRAFSFNKTPNKLKRAVSTMMTSPFGSTNSLTPATQLAQMRLASCTNIHEVADEDGASMRSNSPSAQSEVLVVPHSVQPTRKNKTAVGRI